MAVAAPICTLVEVATLAVRLLAWRNIQSHPPATLIAAKTVSERCDAASDASTAPEAPAAIAGKAIGNKQQAPHAATAVVDVAMAVPTAVFDFTSATVGSYPPQQVVAEVGTVPWKGCSSESV